MEKSPVGSFEQLAFIPAAVVRIVVEIVIDQEQQKYTFDVRSYHGDHRQVASVWQLPLRDWETFRSDLQQTMAELELHLSNATDPF